MKNNKADNIKLGLFVLAALLFLILLLYMIGKNSNMFGDNYILRARFDNVQGLKAGNNIRYAGIDIGTVKSVYIVNDSSMEIRMIIDKKASQVIKKNAIVTIGTDGLVGNKVVNIIPVSEKAPYAVENDILPSRKPVDTDEMLRTLSKTNNQLSKIADSLARTISKLNNSDGLWQLLNDRELAVNISIAAAEIKKTSIRLNHITAHVMNVADDMDTGNGTFARLIHDGSIADSVTATISNLKQAGLEVSAAAVAISNTTKMVSSDISEGNGTVHTLLKDSAVASSFSKTMKNIEAGTKAFSENMEALKHNILFRGYFRKIEKKKSE